MILLAFTHQTSALQLSFRFAYIMAVPIAFRGTSMSVIASVIDSRPVAVSVDPPGVPVRCYGTCRLASEPSRLTFLIIGVMNTVKECGKVVLAYHHLQPGMILLPKAGVIQVGTVWAAVPAV